MTLRSFSFRNQKSIRFAEALVIPKVMVIAGPNGAGKSTLLYAIRQGPRNEDAGTRIFYQGPHRVMRSTQVQRRWLGGGTRSLLELLSGGEVTGFEGLNFHNSHRTPGNVDEAGSTIKHILGKIENRRQAFLSNAVDRFQAAGTNFDVQNLPDVYGPLKSLTEYILPHLRFLKIDFENEDNVRCLWERKDAASSVPVDIDDLSSGEKAVVVLFLPLLEDELQEHLRKLESFGNEGQQGTDFIGKAQEHRVVLIDEPEQHLHPDLQAKILTYMRRTAELTSTQFIVTSHSPTILDQAFNTELFVLSGPSDKNEDENQLKQVSTNTERLEALKQLAGSAYFLTTGRVVVCIEGERDADPEKPTDARLLELLYPRAAAVTLVPTTGKGNVIVTVQRLRENMAEEAFRIRVRGLVDADQTDARVDGVEQLPVCMIENFLLNPECMHTYIVAKGIEGFQSIDDVRSELRSVARGMRDKEISLRLRRRIKPKLIRLNGSTVEELKLNLQTQVAVVQDMLPSDDRLDVLIAEVTEAVDTIINTELELDQFRGKELLNIFYQRHIAPRNISYNSMCIELARIVADSRQVIDRLDPVFDRLLAD